MKNEIAQQIADLLNSENELVIQYTAKRVLESSNNYLYEENNGIVKAFIECKKTQWYQSEVCHLTVNPKYRRQGLGKLIINKALEHAVINLGAKIVQCTIRDGNVKSEGAFTKSGFIKTSTFHYQHSGNNVGVWQKVVSAAT